ncbi:MAG: GTPase HflX [Parachlamydiaceae bacterium]
MMDEPLEKTLLIATYGEPKDEHLSKDHLNELELLTETYGAAVVGKAACHLKKCDAATFLSKGKLDEMVDLAKHLGANLVIIDEEISPSQQRNLEKLFGMPVIDRSELILEVFAQRALTKEARLQVELAKLRYESPRLKRLWTHLSRQTGTSGGGGGGAYLKGEGEKQIELDRRIIKNKIVKLNQELDHVRLTRQTQRSSRERAGIPTFAIIGYTNAGKSTLMNALTNAGVLVENKLFATLDTTTRKFALPDGQEILLIDTVGFIRKLPHHLVAAFKSTLEEALFADVLLNVVDMTDPAVFEHVETTYEVLKELKASKRPIIHLLNKVDLLEDKAILLKFRLKYPHTLPVSALQKTGFDLLLEKITQELQKRSKTMELRIPQKDYAVVSEITRVGRVIHTDYDGNDILLKVELPNDLAGKFLHYADEALN